MPNFVRNQHESRWRRMFIEFYEILRILFFTSKDTGMYTKIQVPGMYEKVQWMYLFPVSMFWKKSGFSLYCNEFIFVLYFKLLLNLCFNSMMKMWIFSLTVYREIMAELFCIVNFINKWFCHLMIINKCYNNIIVEGSFFNNCQLRENSLCYTFMLNSWFWLAERHLIKINTTCWIMKLTLTRDGTWQWVILLDNGWYFKKY